MHYRKRREKVFSEINITPFTDVILVLLVIFMITTPLLSQASIKIKLPEATNTNPIKTPMQVTIAVTDEGLVYINKDLVTRKELKNKIQSLHKKNPHMSVLLCSDKLTRFKDIVGIIDVLAELKITRLDIAANPEQK